MFLKDLEVVLQIAIDWMQQGEDCGIFSLSREKSEWLKMRAPRDVEKSNRREWK